MLRVLPTARILRLCTLLCTVALLAVFTSPYLSYSTQEQDPSLSQQQHLEECQRLVSSLESSGALFIDAEAERADQTLIHRTRRFNHCVFKDTSLCTPQVEHKVYDWMTGEVPTITTMESHEQPMFQLDEGECLFIALRRQLTGRGIVLTATETHLKAIVNIIVMLRTMDSTLPLQIVHKGEISEFTKKRLFQTAQSDWEDDKVIKGMLSSTAYKTSFRKLDLSFIDVSPAIREEYMDRFVRFNNKLLASLFNTFSEMIMIDTDTVLLVNPMDFFHSEQYKASGTFFFKDRSLANTHKKASTMQTFTTLFPNDYDTLFGITKVTEYTMNQRFFQGFLHLQESGVVVINKRRHFEPALMATTLCLHTNSIMEHIWGDKELYWLSFAISGNEHYQFNRNHAASVGEISPDPDHTHYPSLPHLKELCSSHPAHIANDNQTLLWINSGFKHCKRIQYHSADNPFFKGWSAEDEKMYNQGPLRIKDAIIPPEPTQPGLTDIDTTHTRGWVPKDYCEMYTLCAYDKVTGLDTPGTVVTFTEEQRRWYDHLANSWFKSIEVLGHLTSKDVQ